MKGWSEKFDDWICPICMQETPASEVVACCVKDIEDKNPQVMPLDKGQHIHRHRLPVLTQMNFSKNLLESPAYLRHSVMEHLIDKNMNRLVDRVMKETRYVRNKNTDEYKEIIKDAAADILKDTRDENYLPPPTNYFKEDMRDSNSRPWARLHLTTRITACMVRCTLSCKRTYRHLQPRSVVG